MARSRRERRRWRGGEGCPPRPSWTLRHLNRTGARKLRSGVHLCERLERASHRSRTAVGGTEPATRSQRRIKVRQDGILAESAIARPTIPSRISRFIQPRLLMTSLRRRGQYRRPPRRMSCCSGSVQAPITFWRPRRSFLSAGVCAMNPVVRFRPPEIAAGGALDTERGSAFRGGFL